MAFKPYSVVPFTSGLEKDKEPFILPDDAFPELSDCFLYQGKIAKREGTRGISDELNDYSGAFVNVLIAGSITYTNTLVNIPIVVRSITIGIRDDGIPATLYAFVDDGLGNLNAGAGTSGVIDYTTGIFTINFPALPAPTGIYNVGFNYGCASYYSTSRIIQQQVNGALGNTGASPFVVNIFALLPGIGTLGIQPGSIAVNIAAPVGPLTFWETFPLSGILLGGGLWVGTIDYVTGNLILEHPAAAASAVTITLNYYTGRPAMGLITREEINLNRESLLAFDTRKANRWGVGMRRFEDISYDTAGNAITWTSGDANFFWGWNYYRDAAGNKLTWVTNFVRADRLRYYNGVAANPGVTGGWTIFRPQIRVAANWFLDSALLIVSYRDRLVVLNTLETENNVAITHPNRARWCQNGTPLIAATSWLDDTVGLGGYTDAPTAEAIVSCDFFKDTLIVFFERSTWQLAYTGNDSLPFVWYRINTQLGCESTHSVVVFDKGIFAVGDKAIIASDSVNVDRIDQKIPLEVFEIHNQSDGPSRVHGIRDFYYQFVYWTFPSINANQDQQTTAFPDRLLVLNYKEGSFSIYNDSYTCLGYHQDSSDAIWATSNFSWASAIGTWSSARRQADFPAIVGGNQIGYVVVLNEKSDNDQSIYITNPVAGLGITQAIQAQVNAPSHNLKINQFVVFSGVHGMTTINGRVGKIVRIPNVNTIIVDIDTIAMPAYTIGGELTVINNIEIITKKFNPFFQQGKQVRASYADFFVERTSDGKFSVDFYVDDAYDNPISTFILSTQKEYGPLVDDQKIWQRLYCDCRGQFLQLGIYMSDAQMRDLAISSSNIVIHALNLWFGESGRLQSYDI